MFSCTVQCDTIRKRKQKIHAFCWLTSHNYFSSKDKKAGWNVKVSQRSVSRSLSAAMWLHVVWSRCYCLIGTTFNGQAGMETVKCTLVQALRLCTGRKAHRGVRGIALPFLDHGTRRGWGVSVTPRPLFTPGKDPVSIVQEAGWAPGPV